MKTFLAKHDGHYLGPGMTLVTAESEEEARKMVAEEIVKYGLNDWEHPIKLYEIPTDRKYVRTIWDGDY